MVKNVFIKGLLKHCITFYFIAASFMAHTYGVAVIKKLFKDLLRKQKNAVRLINN